MPSGSEIRYICDLVPTVGVGTYGCSQLQVTLNVAYVRIFINTIFEASLCFLQSFPQAEIVAGHCVIAQGRGKQQVMDAFQVMTWTSCCFVVLLHTYDLLLLLS